MNNNYFISRNYKAQFTAAGKAKIDCEKILERIGFKNLGFHRTTISHSIIGSILTFFSTVIGLIRLKKNSTICIQYPIKKYYNLIVKVAILKKCKVITVIHDLRSHRNKRLSVATEIKSFNRNHIIISHNEFMSKWLLENHLICNVVNLNIFDYLSPEKENKEFSDNKFELVFAGALGMGKNGFIYDLDAHQPKNYKMNLYGVGFEEKMLQKNSIIDYKGFFAADKVVNELEGSFGLVWDGTSVEECAGNFGEYLKINNPHKTSLYLRAGLPIIIWDKAAIAKFILENNVGIAISSLTDLDSKLEKISQEQYLEMKKNAEDISVKLGDGFYLKSAIKQSI
jgi:hypothetical protein